MLEVKRGIKRTKRNSNKKRAELKIKFLKERIVKGNVAKKQYKQFVEMMNTKIAEEREKRRQNVPVVQLEKEEKPIAPSEASDSSASEGIS